MNGTGIVAVCLKGRKNNKDSLPSFIFLTDITHVLYQYGK